MDDVELDLLSAGPERRAEPGSTGCTRPSSTTSSTPWAGASLRPLQELAIDAVLDGANLLLLAPTAGGKTEAAFFPLIADGDEAAGRGLAVLYVSPIKALLNNQQARLEPVLRPGGRRAAVWHGDVPASARKRHPGGPARLLLTTPESLEVMLFGLEVDHARLFAGVRAVVVDEVHAFARDDRGWHLLAVLERIAARGQALQRIGLSATVGNEDDLLGWLSGRARPAGHLSPGRRMGQAAPGRRPHREPGAPPPGVQLDYVGSLDNAATVIAALHRGEKRLVFCDSRPRVEQLAAALREREVDTFVSHTSLGSTSGARPSRRSPRGATA